MSQLHWGLLAIGALVITSVLIYNWWQERRIRRDMVQRFDGPIDDVLMGNKAAVDSDADEAFAMESESETDEEDFEASSEIDDEIEDELEDEEAETAEDAEQEWDEPEFTASESDEVEDETQPTIEESSWEEPDEELAEESEADALLLQEEEPEPVVEEAIDFIPTLAEPVPPVSESTSAPATALPAWIDSQVDEIATVAAAKAVSGEELNSLLNKVTDFGKPVLWFGASQGVWLPLSLPLTPGNAQREFSHIGGALQLADRSGAVQPKGWGAFQDQIETFSAQLGSAAVWQEQRDVLQYAEMLDRFCIDVDVTVRLHLAAGISGPFAGTKFRSLMEASGLSLKEDGRFHFTNDQGDTVFTISNADQQPLTEDSLRTLQMHEVLLLLDVPRVADASNVFKQMALLGNRMETALNAKLTDAKQRALGDTEIEQIRSQIKGIHSKMQERMLVPGSAPVLRLFS